MFLRSSAIPVLALLVLSPITLFCQEQVPWEEVQKLEGDPDSKIAEVMATELQATRIHSIERLIAIVGNRKLSHSTRLSAVSMLGDLRASEATSLLLSEMTILVHEGVVFERNYEVLFPCAWALVKIGNPASKEALIQLRNETDAKKRSLLCYILSSVNGTRVARLLVEYERDRTMDEVVKKNLQNALDTNAWLAIHE